MTKQDVTDFGKCVKRALSKFPKLNWLLQLNWVVLGLHPHRFWHFLPHWPQFRASNLLTTIFSRRENQHVYVETVPKSISRMEDKRSKVFIAHKNDFVSQWQKYVRCKNLGLKLDGQQFRTSIALLPAHTCHCGKKKIDSVFLAQSALVVSQVMLLAVLSNANVSTCLQGSIR